MAEASEDDSNKKEDVSETIPKPRVIRTKRYVELPVIDRRNWMIHQHYVRNQFDVCKSIIGEQLQETNGECTFALYVNAMILRSEGEINKSLELLQMCIAIQPNDAVVMKQIARNLFLLGKYKNAIDCYNRSASIGGKDWEISHNLGVIYMQLKQYDQAEQSFNDAIVLNRHDVTFIMLSKLYIAKGLIEKAIYVLKNGLSQSPENTEMLTTLGLMYLQEKKYHKAFEQLGQALTFDTENFEAILGAGSLMQAHGDYDVALAKYRVAAQKCPESASLWNNIAMCFFGKSKYVASIACLKRAAYLSPFDWKIQYNLALIHLTMQQPASAFKFASTALALKSDNSNLYVLLGVALANLGEMENAEKSYEEALKLYPNNALGLINLATHLCNTQKSKRNIKPLIIELAKVLQEHPNKEVLEAAKKLAHSLNFTDIFIKKEKPTAQASKTKVAINESNLQNNMGLVPPKTDTKLIEENSSTVAAVTSKQSVPELITGASKMLAATTLSQPPNIRPIQPPIKKKTQTPDSDIENLLPSVPKEKPFRNKKKTLEPL